MFGPLFRGSRCRSAAPRRGKRGVRLGSPFLLAVLGFLFPPRAVAASDVSLPPIVFVSREFFDTLEMAREPVRRASSGRLLLREADGTVRTLSAPAQEGSGPEGTTSRAPADVLDPDVSYDATRIVFSGYCEEESAWRIYEVGADGSDMRQITRSHRSIDLGRFGEAAPLFESYDDLDPCYLPDGRICFVSTRHPGTAPDERFRSTNLYVVNADGSSPHRITSERFAADTPAVHPGTGQIVFSRWWRSAPPPRGSGGNPNPPVPQPPPAPDPVPPGSPQYYQPDERVARNDDSDPTRVPPILSGISDRAFPGVNNWFLAVINPDGTGMAMYQGVGLDRAAGQAYRPAFESGGSALALFLPQAPFHGVPGENGIRRIHQGAVAPEMVAGIQFFGGQTGPEGTDGEFTGASRFGFESAVPLPDGRILASAKLGAAGTHDLYIVEPARGGRPIHRFLLGDPKTAEIHAVPVVPRPVPPTIADKVYRPLSDDVPRTLAEAYAMNGSFTFRVENLFANGGLSMRIPNAPPLSEKLNIEFFTSFQRTSIRSADPPILIRRLEIGADGKVETQLPAGVPLFEVLRRSDGTIPRSRDGQIFHVGGFNYGQADQVGRCVGCHAGHSMVKPPRDASWINVAPSALVTADSRLALGGSLLRTTALIDHSTEPVRGEWAAAAISESAQLAFTWQVPVRGRKVLLHRPIPGEGPNGTRSLQLTAFTASTSLRGKEQEFMTVRVDLAGPVLEASLNEEKPFDELRIFLFKANTTGLYEGVRTLALAEVEVHGRPAAELGPLIEFTRGDANCDGEVDLSDSVSTLDALFQGAGPVCCEAAADADGDLTADISDPIFLLNHLFAGGPPLPEPYPRCGSAPERGLSCGVASCN